MEQIIKRSLAHHKQAFTDLKDLSLQIKKAGETLVTSLRAGGKIITMGNGGSAADSQHMAAELVGHFQKERRPFPALALTTNSSTITALGNDYGFDLIFARQLEALGTAPDVVIAFSTSGCSANIIQALDVAKRKHLTSIGILGKSGGKIKHLVDQPIIVKHHDTPRIQEMHILIVHILCEIIEEKIS